MTEPKRKLRDDPVVQAWKKHGFLTVHRAMGFSVAWAYCANKIGHDPTITEYINWWRANESTAYREQAAFRQVTGLDNPRPILDRAAAAGLVVEDKPEKADGFALLPFMIG